MTRRNTILAILSLSLVVACSRSTTGEKATADAGQPVSGDWAIVRYDSEPETLNPLLNRSANAAFAISGINNSQIYEYLLGYNTKDWRLTEPLLAESLPEESPDHLTYTFTIRDGVKWHDGQPLTPEDVLFTFKAAMCPLVDDAPKRSFLIDLADVQVDGRKVRFQLSKANSF